MPRKFFKNWNRGKEIARGGQNSTIYLTQKPEGTVLVCKAIMLTSEKQKKRFIGEVRAQSALSHRNIMPIIDSNLDDIIKNQREKHGYIVMPYADKGSLTENSRTFENALDLTMFVFRSICEAVQHGHEHNVLHRDIKPRNILFYENIRNPLLADFGICYVLEENGERITTVNETVGPDHFMAPEQEKGRNENVDQRVDVYSLGKLLYYMLTGGERIYREDYEKLSIKFDNPRYQDIDEKLLLKMIRYRPEDRFLNMKQVLNGIEQVMNELGIKPSNNSNDPNGSNDIRQLKAAISQKSSGSLTNLINSYIIRMEKAWGGLCNEYAGPGANYEKALLEFKDSMKGMFKQIQMIIMAGSEADLEQALKYFQALYSLQENRSGNERLLSVPLTIMHHAFYFAGVVAMHKRNAKMLNKLLNATIIAQYYTQTEGIYKLYQFPTIFAPEIFASPPTRVFDDLINDCRSKQIPTELFSECEGLFLTRLCEIDLITSLLRTIDEEQGRSLSIFIPNFGRFLKTRLQELISELQNETPFAREFVELLFGEEIGEFRVRFHARMKTIRSWWYASRVSGFFSWDSIDENVFK